MNHVCFKKIQFIKRCVDNMHSLFGITFVLLLLKLSAAKGLWTTIHLSIPFKTWHFILCRNGSCTAVCNQGCLHGSCIKPDHCFCNFGWIGINCSTACECHGKGRCINENQLDHCQDCQDNTTVSYHRLEGINNSCLFPWQHEGKSALQDQK